MIMVFAGGHISGGHDNPAISTAVLARGKLHGEEFLPYLAAQAVGAVLAALVVRALGDNPAHAAATASTGKTLIVEFPRGRGFSNRAPVGRSGVDPGAPRRPFSPRFRLRRHSAATRGMSVLTSGRGTPDVDRSET